MANRKPRNLKVVQGTFRKDRENPKAPQLPSETPSPAEGVLTPESRAHFDRLVEILSQMRVLTSADIVSLEILSVSLAEFYQYEKFIEKHGAIYQVVTREGATTFRRRPETVLKSEAWQRCSTLLARFGLDPVNRERVSVLPETKSNKWEKLEMQKNEKN